MQSNRDKTSEIILEDYLDRLGMFRDWSSRYVELTASSISYYRIKGTLKLGQITLGFNTEVADSNLRHFCFRVFDRGTNESMYLSCKNNSTKEKWKESIQEILMSKKNKITRGISTRRALTHTNSLRTTEEATLTQIRFKQHLKRPTLYVKIHNARDLYDKDGTGQVDCFVEVAVGLSTVRTKPFTKSINPEWNSVYQFDWTPNNRYVSVEVIPSDDSNGTLGSVLIPLFSALREKCTHLAWYDLSKRVTKSNVRGSIKIELMCSDFPGIEPNLLCFYQEILRIPEFRIKLLDRPDPSESERFKARLHSNCIPGSAGAETPATASTPSKSNGDNIGNDTDHRGRIIGRQLWEGIEEAQGFPFYFPSCESECLEDFAVQVSLVSTTAAGRLSTSGVLFLTNYRLIFVSTLRIADYPIMCVNQVVNNSDLTTQIAIGSIERVTISSEPELYGCSQNALPGCSQLNNMLTIKTMDLRLINFVFNTSAQKPDPTCPALPVFANWSSGGQDQLLLTNITLNGHENIRSNVINRVFSLDWENEGLDSNLVEPIDSVDHILDSVEEGQEESSDPIKGSSNPPNNSSPIPKGINQRLRNGTMTACNSDNRSTSVAGLTYTFPGLLPSFEKLLDIYDASSLDCLGSPEGDPAARFYDQLKLKKTSRNCLRLSLLRLNHNLIDIIRGRKLAQDNDNEAEPVAYFYHLGQKVVESSTATNTETSLSNVEDETNLVRGMQELASIESATPSENMFSSRSLTVTEAPMQRQQSTADPIVPQGEYSPSNPITEADLVRLNFSSLALERRLNSLDKFVRDGIYDRFTSAMRVFDPVQEFARMNVPDYQWRLTDINTSYEVSPTYPAILAIPTKIEDEILLAAANFRSKNRFPTLSWRSVVNKCTICRSSQPLVGLIGQRSPQDEQLIREIMSSSGVYINRANNTSSSSAAQYVITDARPLLNSLMNRAAGKGSENEKYYENTMVLYLGIPNIHVMRKSLELLSGACLDEGSWMKTAEQSGWLHHVARVLKGALRIVHCIAYENVSVLVHCSDGWDRTAQLTSLAMLLLDPYYRTLRGFVVLIEKEWMSFGHKFADRLGWTYEGTKDEEKSPIFLQFLDCVHQCILQHPGAFEFNEYLLLYLAEHIHSGWFADFMFNTELERKQYQTQHGYVSIWMPILSNPEQFSNFNYKLHHGVLLTSCRFASIVLWKNFFNKWHECVWKAVWLQDTALVGRRVDDMLDQQYEEDADGEAASRGAWIDDKDVKHCKKCHVAFSLFRRKHHCRRCGLIFCEKCASESRLIESVSTWFESRVCLDCATIIDETTSKKVYGTGLNGERNVTGKGGGGNRLGNGRARMNTGLFAEENPYNKSEKSEQATVSSASYGTKTSTDSSDGNVMRMIVTRANPLTKSANVRKGTSS